MPKVSKIKDNIIILKGDYNYEQDQMFKLSKKANGVVISATKNIAHLLVIGDPTSIKIQTEAHIIPSFLKEIEVYQKYFGSIISPWGDILGPQIIYKKQLIKESKKIGEGTLDNEPPFLLDRIRLYKPLLTGMTIIDLMIPLGHGQRELIIGDRKTGKTTIALNTIINQKNNNIKTIYVAIGQKTNAISHLYKILEKHKSTDNVIVIYANPDSPAEQMFAPKVGMAMAEALAYQGEDVLVIFDDLSKHANIYREISLSIGKNPGREAYPPDIFHNHAKLLERAGHFNGKYQNGSITCLPIVETIQNDIASLIPSNIISITDGQIFTSADLFNSGFYPAIDIGLSVSRTGSSVQTFQNKWISKGLKTAYSDLWETKKFADMSVDIADELKAKVEDWTAINNLLMQFGFVGYSSAQMEILIALFNLKVLDKIVNPLDFTTAFLRFCQSDLGAKKIINSLDNNLFKSFEAFIEAIQIVFIPFIHLASGFKSEAISQEEYSAWKGGV